MRVQVSTSRPLLKDAMCSLKRAGIAALLKSVSPDIHVVGCQPAASDVMLQSVLAGHIVDVPSKDTLSDGRRGSSHRGIIVCSK